jgi:hypothetical protein
LGMPFQALLLVMGHLAAPVFSFSYLVFNLGPMLYKWSSEATKWVVILTGT